MTRRIAQPQLAASREIVAAPAERACTDHSFELPTAIFIAMAGLLFAFLGVMTIGFANPGLAVPMAINFAFLTAFFAVPAIFVGASHGGPRALRWSQFIERGVDTATGHSGGREAAVLTLLLPVLILFWAVAVVVIAAMV